MRRAGGPARGTSSAGRDPCSSLPQTCSLRAMDATSSQPGSDPPGLACAIWSLEDSAAVQGPAATHRPNRRYWLWDRALVRTSVKTNIKEIIAIKPEGGTVALLS